MDLKKITLQVAELVKETGVFIRNEAANFDFSEVEYKKVNNLVSYVDIEAEKKLVAGLKGIVPEAGVLGEEGTANELNKEYMWCIDPLDGTTNFSHGIPTFSVSVALLHNDELIVGVVLEVVREECFYAWKDGGAYLNGERIHVSNINKIEEALIGTGFPYYMFDDVPAYLDILKDFMKNTHGIRRIGSAAADLAYVACGRFDGFFEYYLKPWDVAAGLLLVKEAGGEVSDFYGGDELEMGMEVVASGHIQEQLLEVIQKYWRRKG